VNQLFIRFKKTFDSDRRVVSYNICIEIIPMKLLSLMEMCVNQTYRRVRIGKYLSDMYPIKNGLKQAGTLSPFLFNSASKYAVGSVQVNQYGLKLSDTHQLLVYVNL
jgi:hypothetical protein